MLIDLRSGNQVRKGSLYSSREYTHIKKCSWPDDRVVVIDTDLGKSGASTDREGFQRLVGDVGMGKAGIVLGLEVSRLARNSSDWHRLLEICALTDTLILDEDGLYNPADFNDRLLLGMKGTMSEAELHVLRARLQGGLMNKARRGELRMPLPVGFCCDARDQVVLHPDRQVQEVIGVFFKTYRRTGSAMGVVKWFREQKILFPRALKNGPNRGQIDWTPLSHSRAVHTLRNPRYAGVYVFGRTKTRKQINGPAQTKPKPMEEWDVVIPDAHAGYITWQEYNDNLKTLQACAKAHGSDRRDHPPGEGPALLQGMVGCGVCGKRMTVKYHSGHGKTVPDYLCQSKSTQYGADKCQAMNGGGIDRAVGELLLELVEPMTLDLSMHVQHEVQARLEEADSIRRQGVDRARYQADLARERFMNVDPRNRLVADQLEADWNEKLREATRMQQDYEEQREKDRLNLDEAARRKIRALAKDFPRIWNDPSTSDKQRKRMARLLIEDVTLTRFPEYARVQIRFRGGQTRSLDVPHPPTAWQMRKTPPEMITEIDRLLDHYTESEIVQIFVQRGRKSAAGCEFNRRIIFKICNTHGLANRKDRLLAKGWKTAKELAIEHRVAQTTIRKCSDQFERRACGGERYLYKLKEDHHPEK
ncbi:recombinase family protein [Pontiella sulfatireligans]|uniref:Recombinase domain-containing protein n=1 Tax=Pontiella sulfatireligans TaxID=2750658 RepID=A0A6C2UI98_9BACT|nr:recombinase family protein [Pontiella sulfatireligans]VGO19054.1 hypothetical protein SCARR_01110 [Pontiella sulfatireligans]